MQIQTFHRVTFHMKQIMKHMNWLHQQTSNENGHLSKLCKALHCIYKKEIR